MLCDGRRPRRKPRCRPGKSAAACALPIQATSAKTYIMQWSGILPLLILTGAMSPDTARRHEDLMNEIEKRIVLPPGARPLSAYGRNYAFSGRDRVLAVYLIPERRYDERGGCVHGDGIACTKQEVRALVRESDILIASQAAAGRRRWHEQASSLPDISDGGCTQITIRYDMPRKRVLSVACNGFA